MRLSKNSGRRLIAVGASALALMVATPAASAQLPGGVTVEDARAAVAAPINVPAGETVTIDVGVPVSASSSGGGWSVSSAGTSVTVTAPAEPGAQASVPASALGQRPRTVGHHHVGRHGPSRGADVAGFELGSGGPVCACEPGRRRG